MSMIMVFSSLSSLVSLALVLGSVVLSVVSLNVLGFWVGMELNFLSAICFMSGTSVEEGESVMKYFVMQVLGSCFLVLGFLMIVNFYFAWLVKLIILVGLAVKLGIFPFHFWVPSVMSGLSWAGCFVVSVIQKIVPLWMVSNLLLGGEELSLMEAMASLTCMMGCLGGLGVLSYRVLLAYSSLAHLGFLVILSCVDVEGFFTYMTLYFLLNFCLMFSLASLKVYCFSDLVKEDKTNFLNNVWWSSLYFLSLAGLPPFSGCALKSLFVLSCWNWMSVGCVLCLLSSAVSLYFYLSVVGGLLVYWGKGLCSLVNSKFSSSYYLSGLSVLINVGVGFLMFLVVGL